ncbi:MAG: glycosyltransferase [Chitinophagaceae bacterium]|nr:glycosyltransferase [Chitinophagaceae bacterium]MBK8311801.1 glycosyltransferase [Chitinophagaceae bacterium]MBK8607972.1 glycosyltransferase [Chitinophagaceae bacterium]MBP6477261.1 glycosyltransferase [Chitinophagaceae bacterium]MBP7109011.1 glycosyltransferase [Chitinophagaceae bacterium]
MYSLLIAYYWQSWKAISDFIPLNTTASTTISIIIPARNEEKNIGQLFQALQNQTYPTELFEVIVVDDHSTDGTAAIVQQFPSVKLIQLKEDNINSYKKKAIETGIAAATGDLIVTTDADCLPGNNWLTTIAAFKTEKQSAFIAAPVVLENNNSLLQIFQTLDFLVLQGITGASVYKNAHSMCNGANLAYEKKAFQEVNGFQGIDNIASGDDMLLMHKIWKQYPDKVHYLKSKEAIVSTQPMKTWKAFFNQRIRWASKAKSYGDKRIIVVLLLVYLLNLSFLVLSVVGFFCSMYWIFLLGLWLAKTMVEFPFVYSVASFFNKKSLLKYFLFFQPLHIIYTILSGLFGQFGKYEWKGRRVS